MIIYRNESYLLEDMIKKRFKKEYKNLEISITLDILNDLLKGINIRLINKTLNDSRSFYIWNKDYSTFGEYIDDIFKMISINLEKMVYYYYTA